MGMRLGELAVLGLLLAGGCGGVGKPQPQLSVGGGEGGASEPALEVTAAELEPRLDVRGSSTDLVPEQTSDGGGCPFKACSLKDYPEVVPGLCEVFGWDPASCDCGLMPAPVGAACEDDDPCTVEESCDLQGHCLGVAPDCSDGNPCTTDSCVPMMGCHHAPNSNPCEDGNPCTGEDHCEEGSCHPGAPLRECAVCDPAADLCEQLWGDGDLCNGLFQCFLGSCMVAPATVVSCPQAGLPPCFVSVCQAESGLCLEQKLSNGSKCDDGNFCTKDDYCVDGECAGFVDDSIAGCVCVEDEDCGVVSQGDLCLGKFQCQSEVCAPSPGSAPPPCDVSADLPCLKNLCNPLSGQCEVTQMADGTACEDTDPCTLDGICGQGQCLFSGALDCSGLHGPCFAGGCLPEQGGCVPVPANEGEPCEAGDPCVLSASCQSGYCLAEAKVECDDGDPCTVDSCQGGECVHEPGGGEWQVDWSSPLQAQATVGLPAAPGQFLFKLTSLSSAPQSLVIFESDGAGTEVDLPWLALNRRLVTLAAQGEEEAALSLYPAVAGLSEGYHQGWVTVRDGCGEQAGAVSAAVALVVAPAKAEQLFFEPFDADPFASDRWSVLMGDCKEAAPGSVVFYSGAADGCGAELGYVYREAKGERCLEYAGPPFTSEGYDGLMLSYAYRLGGGSVKVSIRKNGKWSPQFLEAKGTGMAEWAVLQGAVDGTVDGLRFILKAAADEVRRLDCITLTGKAACLEEPKITKQPAGVTAAAGESVVLAVEAAGENLSWRWLKDGEKVVESEAAQGTLSPVLTLPAVAAEQAGKYRCRITGNCQELESKEATVTVQ